MVKTKSSSPRFIFKIQSSKLRRANWNLTLSLSDARLNDEVVGISNSQVLRWIDEINGMVDIDVQAKRIKSRIKRAKKAEDSASNRKKIKDLYAKLDEYLFKADYVCITMDSEKDYWRAVKGFKINDITYARLVGTSGGVKESSIVFVNADIVDELRRRIDNGRNMEKEFVPAKLEAYRSLVCSGSHPVSFPKGIAVVNDCVTCFTSDVITLSNEDSNEPVMKYEKDYPIELEESDGYGLMLPSLAARWSEELGLSFVSGGMNTRFAFEKGMAFCFDFLDFADNVAHTRIIKDVWGNEVDLSNVELILTTSMLKLWDSYDSCEQYIRCSLDNGYEFGIAKTCPEQLEKQRDLNYQFIQSYDLTDEQIVELASPTVNEIKDILNNDYHKTILFLRGGEVDHNRLNEFNDYTKAIMIDKRMLDDPFVKRKLQMMLKKRINDAKIGVLQVHGNYSVICGDPYSLCQSIFGMPITGILKAGEIYNKYWLDVGAEKLACYRAPMTCHNNIRKVSVHKSEEAQYWYRYMPTCTLFNSWDTAAHALNGCDK